LASATSFARIDRLRGLVGQEVRVYIWSGSDKRDVIAGLTGTLERAQSDAGRAAQRASLIEQMQRGGLSREIAESEARRVEEQFEAARRADEAGVPLPADWGTAIVAVGADAGTGRREHFMILRAGHRVGDIWITESDIRSAEYDEHGLTLRYHDATLTFMNLYRPRTHRSQR
jgi:hypothetical protein